MRKFISLITMSAFILCCCMPGFAQNKKDFKTASQEYQQAKRIYLSAKNNAARKEKTVRNELKATSCIDRMESYLENPYVWVGIAALIIAGSIYGMIAAGPPCGDC